MGTECRSSCVSLAHKYYYFVGSQEVNISLLNFPSTSISNEAVGLSSRNNDFQSYHYAFPSRPPTFCKTNNNKSCSSVSKYKSISRKLLNTGKFVKKTNSKGIESNEDKILGALFNCSETSMENLALYLQSTTGESKEKIMEEIIKIASQFSQLLQVPQILQVTKGLKDSINILCNLISKTMRVSRCFFRDCQVVHDGGKVSTSQWALSTIGKETIQKGQINWSKSEFPIINVSYLSASYNVLTCVILDINRNVVGALQIEDSLDNKNQIFSPAQSGD